MASKPCFNYYISVNNNLLGVVEESLNKECTGKESWLCSADMIIMAA